MYTGIDAILNLENSAVSVDDTDSACSIISNMLGFIQSICIP